MTLKNHWALLWLLPAVFVVSHVGFVHARGPFYLANYYDPDYVYLFNALNVATLTAPDHVDHPGIPLHILGAALVRLLHVASTKEQLCAEVLVRAEWHLSLLNGTVVTIYLACLLLLPGLVWRKTGDLAAALILQASPFLLGNNFEVLGRFNPEPVLVVVCLLMAALLYLYSLGALDRLGVGTALLFGAIAATGLASKVTFLPVLIVPLLCLESWRERGVYLATAYGCWELWLLPAAPQYGRIHAWLFSLATRQGRYGSGEAGWLPTDYGTNLVRLILDNGFLSTTILLSLACLAYDRWGRDAQRTPPARRLRRLLGGVVWAQLGQFLLVAKSPQVRYLVPAVALCGLNLVAIVRLVRGWRGNVGQWLQTRSVALGLGVAIGCFTVFGLGQHYIAFRADRTDHRQVAEALATQFKDQPVVYFYGASSSTYALSFGNAFAGDRYIGILRELVGRGPTPPYFLNHWTGQFLTLDGPVDFRLMDRPARPFLWMGTTEDASSTFSFLPPDRQPQPIFRRGNEAIYR
jgi:hypothetical protein